MYEILFDPYHWQNISTDVQYEVLRDRQINVDRSNVDVLIWRALQKEIKISCL